MRRSVLSNPVLAGIDAFARLSGVFNEKEEVERRKTLMDQNLLESRQRMRLSEDEAERAGKTHEESLKTSQQSLLESKSRIYLAGKREDRERKESKQKLETNKKAADFAEETRTETRRQWFDSRTENNLAAALSSIKSGIPVAKLPEEQQNALLVGAQKSKNWGKVPVEEWENLNRSIKVLQERTTELAPVIQEAVKNKKRVTISRAQMPDLFDALDNIPSYGPRMNRGDAQGGANVERDGGTTKKSIDQIMIDGEDGTITPLLRVETKKPDGSSYVYFAPKTMDSGVDPNAPVAKLPIALFGADLQSQGDMQKAIEGMLIQYGVKGVAEKVEAAREGGKRSDVLAAGEQAAIDIWNADKKTPISKLRLELKKAARTKAKETGYVLDEKALEDFADDIFEVQKNEFTSPAGRTLSDRARLIAQYGEGSPEVKAFDDEVAKKVPKPTKTTAEKVEEARQVAEAKAQVKAKYDKGDKKKDSAKKEVENKTKLIDKRLKEAAAVIKKSLPRTDAKSGDLIVPEKALFADKKDFDDDEAKAAEESRGRQIAYREWTNEYIRKYDMDPEKASAEAIKQISKKAKAGEKFFTMTGGNAQTAKVIKFDKSGKRIQ